MGSRRDAEDGLSLVELLVTMLILGIVMAGVVSTTVSSQRIVRSNTQRLDDAATARLSIDASSKQLRAAVRISATDRILDLARPDLVRFQADLNGVPVQVELAALADGRFVERHWNPDPASDPPTYSGTPRTRVLATDLDTTVDVFTYLDLDRCTTDPYVCVAAGGLDATADSTTGLAASDLDTIDFVSIALTVFGESNPPTDPFTLETSVTIRNDTYAPEVP